MFAQNGDTVRVHYRGTLDDGSEFDSSYPRGEPIEFQVGAGSVIGGFDEAVRQMEVGQKLTVRIPPENAYGERLEDAVQQVELSLLPEGACVGAMLQGKTEDGHPIAGSITAIDGDIATLDFNHPLAGENLTFEMELVDIQSA